jgi:hypothetical protein
MGERALLAWRQSHGQRPRKADQGEHDVALGEIAAERTIPHGVADESLHEPHGAGEKIGPVSLLQERVNDVHRPDPVIERHVHILAERINSVGNGLDQVLPSTDAPFQHVTDSSVEKGLLVREVPVECSYANAGSFGDGVSGGLAADFQNEFDGDLDKPLPVSLRISPHRRASLRLRRPS